MKDQAKDKRSLIIVGAMVLTTLFLVAFGWLLSRTMTCPEGWWLWDRLSCLEPNALGDAFAGAFAPVAFVWLVAAVLLQRSELAAQRQELRQSREVATQQVEEARKSVENLHQQTEVLKRQHQLDVERYADAAVDRQIEICNLTLDVIVDKLGATHVFDKVLQLSGDDETDPLRRLSIRLGEWNEFADGAREMNSDNGPIEFEREDLIKRLQADLLDLVRVSEIASPAKKLLVRKVGAHEAIKAAELLYSLNKWDPEDFGEEIAN